MCERIILNEQQFHAVECGDKTICRFPLAHQPKLNGSGNYAWKHETWGQFEEIVTKSALGISIGWQCPAINEGLVQFSRVGHESARGAQAVMLGVVIQRLQYSLVERCAGGAFYAEDVSEILAEGFTGDTAVGDYIAAWDSQYGKTLFRFDRNPWVWRLRFRMLTMEHDGNVARGTRHGYGRFNGNAFTTIDVAKETADCEALE